MENQLKTIQEMKNMSIDELNTYENNLYLLWVQAQKICQYKKAMADTRILLNSTVQDVLQIEEKVYSQGDDERTHLYGGMNLFGEGVCHEDCWCKEGEE